MSETAYSISRARYAALYGPTVGDRVRLADTNLLIEVERDLCAAAGYGDEAVFGGGKVIRESMGMGHVTRVSRRSSVINAWWVQSRGIMVIAAPLPKTRAAASGST